MKEIMNKKNQNDQKIHDIVSDEKSMQKNILKMQKISKNIQERVETGIKKYKEREI